MNRSNPATTYGAFEAKNERSELLDLVEDGMTIVLTRHGTPIARLIPFEDAHDRKKVREAIAELRLLRKGTKLRGLSLRDLLREGRK